MNSEQQTHDYYMNVGPQFADPVARQLYAEIASIEEQHVTQYESNLDPEQTPLEQRLSYEAMEVYNYYSCVEQETNLRIKAIWERMLQYELGHLQVVAELFKQHERRDPMEVLPETFPDALPFTSQRDFVRQTLARELDLSAKGTDIVPIEEEAQSNVDYRNHMNSQGSPTEAVGYSWYPGTELNRQSTESLSLP